MKKHATVWKKGFFWEPVSSASLWNSNSLHLFSHHSSQPAVSPLYSHFLFSFCHYLSSPPPPPSPPPPLFLLLRPLSISLALSPFLALHHLPSVSLSLPSTPFPFFFFLPGEKAEWLGASLCADSWEPLAVIGSCRLSLPVWSVSSSLSKYADVEMKT